MIEMYSQLYSAVLDSKAAGVRVQAGYFSYGDFQLVFHSFNNQTIPWEVVGDFLRTMRGQLLMGSVGTLYEATLYFLLGAAVTLVFLNGLAIVVMELSGDPDMIFAAQRLKKGIVT